MVRLCHDQVYTVADPRWAESLDRLPHDVYHTAAYHSVPGLGRSGDAYVFVHRENDLVFLWPYLLTPTDGAAGHHDVTSVYGYAGPVASPDPAFVARGWQALLDTWRTHRVVSAFTRFHPLLGNRELVRGLLDDSGRRVDDGICFRGLTISMDLTAPLDVQFGRYHKKLRNEIRRARDAGLVTTTDERWEHVGDFVRLYRDSMSRLNSRPEYFVDATWVQEFRRALGKNAHLFVTKWNGAVAAASLIMGHGSLLHSHLIGSDPALLRQSPSKALLDSVRIWGAERGFESYHLGGGLGGRQDSLYQSKRKFSPVTHEFYTGSWILDLVQYRELEMAHRLKFASQGIEIGDPGFFPIYRFQP